MHVLYVQGFRPLAGLGVIQLVMTTDRFVSIIASFRPLAGLGVIQRKRSCRSG